MTYSAIQLLNSQLACLLPDAIFDPVMFIYMFIFLSFVSIDRGEPYWGSDQFI